MYILASRESIITTIANNFNLPHFTKLKYSYAIIHAGTVAGGVLAPFSFSGGGAHLYPVDTVAMVSRESTLPTD